MCRVILTLLRASRGRCCAELRRATGANRKGSACGVELAGDGVQACMARRQDIPNSRQDIGRKLRHPCLTVTRRTAGAAGFLILSQCGERPAR
jgi:hypothetical protein